MRSTRRAPTTATCCASSPTIRGTGIRRRRPRFIRHNRARIRRLVAKWTGEYQLTLDAVLDEMIERCRELKLRAVGSERQLRDRFHRAVDRQDRAFALQPVAAAVDRAMKKLRVLVLMHPDLVPPDSLQGLQRAGNQRLEDRVRRRHDAARAPATRCARSACRTSSTPIRDEIESWKPDVVFNLLEEFHGEAVYDQNVVELSRADARALYRLQSARPDAGARQGPVEEARALSPHADAGLRGVPDAAARCKRPPRLALPLIVKSLSEDASLRHRAGLGGGERREARRARRPSSTSGSAPRRSPSNISRAARSTSACSATTACRVLPIWELQFGRSGAGRLADRHREGQARPRIPAAPRRRAGAGQGSGAGGGRAHPAAWPSASAARSNSTATPASISASPPTARRISSRPIPIPEIAKSRGVRPVGAA